MQGAVSRLAIPVVLVLTLGLAPFTPEPHIVGKVRWIAGGAVGMEPMDWFDLLLHGTPFLILAVAIGYEVYRAVRGAPSDLPPVEPPTPDPS